MTSEMNLSDIPSWRERKWQKADHDPVESADDDIVLLPTILPIRAVGWRLVIDPIHIEDTTDGGIMLAPEIVRAQEYLRYVGQVVDIGPVAYSDEKFGGVPWCKVGDWIAFNRNTGQEVVAELPDDRSDGGRKIGVYRIINDDDVMGIIPDPRAIVTRL